MSTTTGMHLGPETPSVSTAADTATIAIPWIHLSDRVAVEGRESPFANDSDYDRFFNRMARALHRTEQRHVVLTRERGVGDQAVLLELAGRIKSGAIPALAGMEVVLINCRTVSPEEVRSFTDAVFNAVGPQSHWIVVLDGFENLLQGATRSTLRVRFLNQLQRARCRIVGIVSPHAYEELVGNDVDFLEQFSAVTLHEPSPEIATKLVTAHARGMEMLHGLTFEPRAIERAISLSKSYILHERLPTKAVKVLRSICDDVLFARANSKAAILAVTEGDVISKIAEISGVPSHVLTGVGDTMNFQQSLGEVILGQPHAVQTVASELSLINAGFADPGKPASVMLFIGQTGTGKTEMAKALARLYSASKRLKTFTLENFSESHSVSGIIGVPAGYVGHDQGGRLINDLNADPYGVFLLDEADKAHPDVLQPFLNLFDEGWIVDQRGVKAHADRAIFILTTNVGQRQMADMFKEGKSIEEITHTMKETLARTRHPKSNRPVFSPEFVARIKQVVLFRPLDGDAMLGITRKLIAGMVSDWREKRQRRLVVSDALVEAIAKRSTGSNDKSQGKEGGRIVRKFLTEMVESPIQREISRDPGAYRRCTCVHVSLEPSDLSCSETAQLSKVVFESGSENESHI